MFKFGFSAAFAFNYSGINGLGVSLGRADVEVGGVVPIHAHPGATELVVVAEGSNIIGGFIASNSKVYQKPLTKGDTMVLPQGLYHFFVNQGNTPAVIYAAFSSESPTVQLMDTSLFKNDLSSDIVAKTTLLDLAQLSLPHPLHLSLPSSSAALSLPRLVAPPPQRRLLLLLRRGTSSSSKQCRLLLLLFSAATPTPPLLGVNSYSSSSRRLLLLLRRGTSSSSKQRRLLLLLFSAATPPPPPLLGARHLLLLFSARDTSSSSSRRHLLLLPASLASEASLQPLERLRRLDLRLGDLIEISVRRKQRSGAGRRSGAVWSSDSNPKSSPREKDGGRSFQSGSARFRRVSNQKISGIALPARFRFRSANRDPWRASVLPRPKYSCSLSSYSQVLQRDKIS
ncbi:hypothetical protein ACLB2K_005352 [Fragaria x ananassa]